MLNSFKKHITTNFPFLFNSKLLLAVSGGVDSIVLTHLCRKCKLDVALAHCNFKLRGAESDDDEKFVISIANHLNIEVFVESFDTTSYAEDNNLSIQMAARELRYRWFKQLSNALGFRYIVTAHQAEDNLETFLINLSRGAGLEGLTGIPPTNKKVVRPLLPFSREEITIYAIENNIKWREDSSNIEIKYLRNRLRHKVIPELRKINPHLISNFQNTIKFLKGSSQIVKSHTEYLKSSLFIREEGIIKIPVSQLLKLKPRKPYLYEIFKEFGFTAWDDVESLLTAGSGKQIFSPTHRMIKDREYLLIKNTEKNNSLKEFFINEGEEYVMRPLAMSFFTVNKINENNDSVIYIDKEKLKFPLIVRKRKEGDYFYPFGMKGKKKLSKFFKDEKYSLLDKENQWLLCSGNEIIWVIGKRADDRFKVTEKTSEIIKIKAH
ncbi:tRNA lysidine(34) synthetase TilS [Abyssalbus ytuae]|uniref:tRNA(Ile)-lysidine synthase n=1 Tax=Abyssalbus ytuae TaxID=2926907 RepID=A0A9E6ZNR6_9FLAO|nr:tRNA lysidine(34) synthetase TilS [Abyssalbus ytuae]UOB17730.1 tRNA lysidine(34) synthetase TilS [Abyssalbus ytuae]